MNHIAPVEFIGECLITSRKQQVEVKGFNLAMGKDDFFTTNLLYVFNILKVKHVQQQSGIYFFSCAPIRTASSLARVVLRSPQVKEEDHPGVI